MTFTTLSHAAQQEMVDTHREGEVKKTNGSSFFRGEDCNFNPYGEDHRNDDFAQRFVLKGWVPDAPFIDRHTKVTAFGSCFAENISKHLAQLGYDTSKQRDRDIYVSLMGEGLVNVHAIEQQFRWALDGWTPPTNLWHGYDAGEFALSEDIREKTRAVFLDTDVFILTFGLSEVWFDAVSGGVFWRAVPMTHYDPSRHKFRVCSFAETKQSIATILTTIRRHVPSAKVIVTLSPIPLIATFRPVSCLTANAASKAILRAALDELLRDEDEAGGAYYFPAYELINEGFPNRFVNDGRHLHDFIVPSIMRLFEASFCRTGLTVAEAERDYRHARLADIATLAQHPLFSQGL